MMTTDSIRSQMKETEQPIYCGSGKEVIFADGGAVINLTLHPDDIPAEYIKTGKSGNRFIRLKLYRRREVGTYGETHALKVDTWQPKDNGQPAPRQNPAQPAQDAPQRPITPPAASAQGEQDNLPF